MWLFNFDGARFCSIEVVPVIIHQLCVSICFSLSCGQGVVTFFIFASLVGGKMFRRLCLLSIFLNMKAIILLLICLRSIYIHFLGHVWSYTLPVFSIVYPFLLDFFMTWIAIIFFPSLLFLFWLSGDFFSEQKY